MKHVCKKCSPRCVYFPDNYSSVSREYTDENGLKHRDGILKCEYDNHRIKKFTLCENYVDYTEA